MDGQVESFGRDIKKNIYGQRAVLVRMTLSERDELRRQSIGAGMSLQQFCRSRLGLPSRELVKRSNSSRHEPVQPPLTERTDCLSDSVALCPPLPTHGSDAPAASPT